MKAIMMSIKPRWVKEILNEEKTIEIRKKFPKDYVGWVYIYNTKTSKDGVLKLAYIGNKLEFITPYGKTSKYQGKVVARFWCDKVEEIKFDDKEVQRQACLTEDELFDYLFINEPYHEDMHKGYGISITKLEIFNKPKELKEFYVYSHTVSGVGFKGEEKQFKILKPLNRAPQSWCYVEI